MVISKQISVTERRFIAADFEKCTGCGVCELVCSLEREKVFNPSCSRIKILRLHQLINMPVTCRLCEDAPCVRACPRDALKQSKETSVVQVDEEKCNSCGWCIEACPYGAIIVHPKKNTVIICDLCDDQPQCVEWCPEGALEIVTQKTFDKKVRKATVTMLIPESWR